VRRWIWLILVAAVLAASVFVIATANRIHQDQTPSVGVPAQPSIDRTPSSPETQGSAASALANATRRPRTLTNEQIGDLQKPVPGKLRDVIDELAPRADAGDARAAHQIFIKITDCKWAIEASTAVIPTTDETAKSAEKARLSEALARLESCEGITQDLIDSRAKWLTMAADNGDPLAQLTYASSSSLILGGAAEMMANPRAVDDFKRKSLNFLMSLSERGDVSAILQLCGAYDAGVLVPQDSVKAYAYAVLANLITGRSQNLVQVMGGNLTIEQQQQGQQIALALHRRCCG